MEKPSWLATGMEAAAKLAEKKLFGWHFEGKPFEELVRALRERAG